MNKYLTFSFVSVVHVCTAPELLEDDSYLSADGEILAIRAALDSGYRWIRTDGSLAIFELSVPVPMIIHCPQCWAQHIDAPNPALDWTNSPHRTHTCNFCGFRFRPADVETIGVESIATHGKVDGTYDPRLDSRPTREDFSVEIPTIEDNLKIGLSMADSFDDNIETALLQTGPEGNYTCSYVNDEQLNQLSNAIRFYLRTRSENSQ